MTANTPSGASITQQGRSFDWEPAALANTLPLIPGYSFDSLKSRGTYRKRQCFNYFNGIPQVADPQTSDVELLPGQHRTSTVAVQQAHPTWLTLDRKVLRFHAFYKEAVHESPNEAARVRRCTIYYFLEDDTMQVSEPHQENSGLSQGCIIRRHKVPKSHDGQDFYTSDDLDVGRDIHIYGRVFHIVDCDAFTRHYYGELGRGVRPFESYPEDPFVDTKQKLSGTKYKNTGNSSDLAQLQDLQNRHEMKRYHEFSAGGKISMPSKEERETAQDFLRYDRQVLRFDAVWDDRKTIHGEYRYFTLLFFLSDKTLKVIEVNQTNAGRDPFPVFIKRAKIPKTRTPHADYNLESMTTKPQDCVTEEDLWIGKTVNLMGRDMLIYNCDDFTLRYYRDRYGVADFAPLEVGLPPKQWPKREPPPHSGFGSEEDSLASWKSLVLKAPKEVKAKGSRSEKRVLRFGGFIEKQPYRRVLLVFYLASGMVGIFEQSSRNTGTVGGKFLQPQRVKKPIPGNATLTLSAPYYQATDFYVGATVNINGHIIVLDKIDEDTVRILEEAPKDFSLSDVNTALKHLRMAIINRFTRTTDAFRTLDEDHDGLVCLSELASFCGGLSDSEVSTLMRYLDVNGDGVIDYNEFIARIQPPGYASELDGDVCGSITEPITEKMPIYKQRVEAITTDAEDDRIFRLFRDKLSVQRSVLLETFRMTSQRALDAKVGIAEFTEAVNTTYSLGISEPQLRRLIRRFFPTPSSRLTIAEFTRILESGSNFERKL